MLYFNFKLDPVAPEVDFQIGKNFDEHGCTHGCNLSNDVSTLPIYKFSKIVIS